MENKETIKNLENRLNSHLDELKKSYISLGEKILTDSVQSPGNSPAGQEESSNWQLLKEQRNSTSEKIFNIKQTINRLDELSSFANEATKATKKQGKELQKMQSKFLLEFYRAYHKEDAYLFLDIKAQIDEIESRVDELTSELDKIETTIKNGSFIDKIKLSPKRINLKMKLSTEDGNLKKLFTEKADDIFNEENFGAIVESKQPLSAELNNLYHEITVVESNQKESTTKLNSITEEQYALKASLHVLASDTKPTKQISLFNAEIKEYDAQINDLSHKVGLEYVNSFFDESGNSSGDKTIDNSTLYVKSLNKIQQNRHEITNIRINIEYLNTINRIAAKEKEIETNKSQIKKQKDIIQKANITIDNAEKAIQDATELKEQLESTAETLKSKLDGISKDSN